MRLLSLALLCATLSGQDLTPAKEAALGRQMAEEIRRRSAPFQSQAVQDYVAQLGAKLSPGYTFSVINHIGSNALCEPTAMPGGYVFVPVDLLLAARSESEFAGMLAQAMARRPVIVQGPLAPVYLTNDSPMPPAAKTLWRESELHGDSAAVPMLARAGFDPNALLDYIERMQPEDQPYSNFPPRAERLKNLQKAIGRQAIGDAPPSTYSESGEFRRMQDLASPAAPKPRTPPSLFTK